jgi:hypothetical protein
VFPDSGSTISEDGCGSIQCVGPGESDLDQRGVDAEAFSRTGDFLREDSATALCYLWSVV